MNFHRIVTVDYSGANSTAAQRKHICLTDLTPHRDQISIISGITRVQAEEYLKQCLLIADNNNECMLIGIDHNLGFPLDFVRHLTKKTFKTWLEQIELLHQSTLFLELEPKRWAEKINSSFRKECGPFWGPGFSSSKKADFSFDTYGFSAKRLVEERMSRMKSIFQLGGTGSVGLQSLHGMIHLYHTLNHCRLLNIYFHVWPFDGWVPPQDKHLILEIYPALYNMGIKGDVEDSLFSAFWLAKLINDNRFLDNLKPKVTRTEKLRIEQEGWVPGIV